MGHVAAFVLGAGIPGRFARGQLVEAAVHLHVEADVVEHEEFQLGAEHGGVADARRLHEGFGALGGRARATGVELAGRGFDDVAVHDQGGLRGEGIEHGGVGIGHQDHVGLVDRLPAGDRGAVEHHAIDERAFISGGGHAGRVLPLAARIGEAEVNELDVLFLDHRENLFRVHISSVPLFCGLRPHAPKGRVFIRRRHRARQYEFGWHRRCATRRSCRHRCGRCAPSCGSPRPPSRPSRPR